MKIVIQVTFVGKGMGYRAWFVGEREKAVLRSTAEAAIGALITEQARQSECSITVASPHFED